MVEGLLEKDGICEEDEVLDGCDGLFKCALEGLVEGSEDIEGSEDGLIDGNVSTVKEISSRI